MNTKQLHAECLHNRNIWSSTVSDVVRFRPDGEGVGPGDRPAGAVSDRTPGRRGVRAVLGGRPAGVQRVGRPRQGLGPAPAAGPVRPNSQVRRGRPAGPRQLGDSSALI